MNGSEGLSAFSSKTETVPYIFHNGMYSTTNYEDEQNLDGYSDHSTQYVDKIKNDNADMPGSASEQPVNEKRVQTADISLTEILKASIALGDNEALYWHRTDFDLTSKLNGLDGPFIEVAGPTEEPYEILKGVVFPKPVTVVNIAQDAEIHSYSEVNDTSTNTHRSRSAYKGVDVLADVRNLPIKDEGISLALVSYLPKKDEQGDLRLAAMHTISRALQPGGLLVWKGAVYEDMVRAEMSGLGVAAVQISDGGIEEVIFQKPLTAEHSQ